MPTPSRQIGSLTGIRAIAAWWVVLYHMGGTLGAIWLPAKKIVATGWLGVDLFFMLSGFVIALNYWDKVSNPGQYGRFVWMRLARLYPVHLVGLLAALGLFVAGGLAHTHSTIEAATAGYTLWTFLQQLLLVHHWIPG